MTVYVNDANIRNKDGKLIICHMCADTLDELHKMAKAIGVSREWHQDMRLPRYALSEIKKEKAIERGAKEVSKADFVFLSSAMKRRS